MYISLEKYNNEEFEYELSELTLSTLRVECNMYQGENYKGTFEIDGNREIQGFIIVSSPRMHCRSNSFCGTHNVIEFEFNSLGMGEGEVVKGRFEIISNVGEYSLPFVATIEKYHVTSSIGSIKNLFHFANLAQNSWSEALKIFESSYFPKIFSSHDRQYLPLYEGLLENADKNYAMEEFLIAIRKKEPVVFALGKQEEVISSVSEDIRETVPLTKKKQGYFEIMVESDVDFLVPYKKYLHEEDFVGNLCPFEYYIKYNMLHAGKNMGKLIFSTLNQKIEFTVVAIRKKESGRQRDVSKNVVLQLTQNYIAFRTKKMNSSTWAKSSLELMEREYTNCKEQVFFELYKVQLLLAEKRTEEAWHILKNSINAKQLKRNDIEDYCYYLYLLALAEQKESARDRALQAVMEAFEGNRRSWKIFWITLYIQEEYERNRQKKYDDIKEFCNAGCNHPVIYIEAVNVMRKEISVLTHLDSFELKVLLWAVKNNQITEEMAKRIVYLASKMTEYSPMLHKILTECYIKYPAQETIQAVCSLLIKNDRRESKYFYWYELAIRNELKITRLYEYYLMSIDTSVYQVLPRNVMMYFLYECDLDYKRQAYLYANLIKNQEAYGDLAEKYQEQVEKFVLKEVLARHMDENLAYLYQRLLKEKQLDENTAEAFASVMFLHKIKIDAKDVQQIIVRHTALYYEESFPCNKGEAYVNIYNHTYILLGEDGYGRRFPVHTVSEPIRLYQNAQIEGAVFALAKSEIGIYIHKLIDRGAYLKVDEQNIEQLRRISRSLIVKQEEKKEFYGKIADFYYESNQMEELDNYLLEVALEELPSKDRGRMIDYMIMRKMYEKSYNYVVTYGAEGVNNKLLLRVCSLFLRENPEAYTEDENFCRLCHYLYDKGKYDTQVLAYLIKYYQGNLGQMRKVWKSSIELGLDNYELEERLLVQSLFAHSHVEELIEIFEDYIRQGARPSIERAFIINQSYEYFVKQKITEETVMKRLYHMFAEGEELPDICKLALLQGFSEQEEMIQQCEVVLKPLVKEMLQKRIYFEFLKKYAYDLPQEAFLLDKTLLEYRKNPLGTTKIHYIQEETQTNEYQIESLNRVYPGVETKEFILFFGEALQYYLTESTTEDDVVVESGRIMRSEVPVTRGESRYELLNDMLISYAMQDEKTLHVLIDKYLKEDYIVKHVFSIK